MTQPAFLADVSELMADAVQRFAAAVASGHLAEAERFAQLAFYLAEHEVRP